MTQAKLLIVNADDFGLSPGVNAGIIQAYEQGIVTSASLMVRGAALTSAVEYARRHPNLSVGLHIDLGEWSYREGQWVERYTVVPLADADRVRSEIYRQLQIFRSHMLCDPTHIDSHQHVHRDRPALRIALEVAETLGVPLRHQNSSVRYCGHFYGQPLHGTSSPEAVSASALEGIIRSIQPGITELACHPGSDEGLASDYARERAWETAALCAPQVQSALESATVLLRSFASEDVRSQLKGLSQTEAVERPVPL